MKKLAHGAGACMLSLVLIGAVSDTAIIHISGHTFTIRNVHAAHAARVSAAQKATAAGRAAAQKLSNARTRTVHVSGAGKRATPLPLATPFFPQIIGLHVTQYPRPFPTQNPYAGFVVEPSSDYANAPADMRAFCSSAQASACLYLPPQQEVVWFGSGAYNYDPLVTQSQCQGEGGAWSYSWTAQEYSCIFVYPTSVTVNFAPASNYQAAMSGVCDSSVFTYQVDPRGAVSIRIKYSSETTFTTGTSPTCVLRVKPGG